MTEETLSALLDGECSPEELDRLLDQLDRSPELKQAYSRLCLSREAREGTRIAKAQACICAGVMAGLDEAPVPASDKLVDLDGRRARRPARALWKPVAGFAAAASFGAVAVLVAMPQTALVAGKGQVAPGFPAEATVPVSLPLPAPARPQGLRVVSAEEDDLNNYLIEHSNTAASRGMGGTLSYARFTAHNAAYRPQEEEQR